MKWKIRAAVALALLAPIAAWSAGNWSTLPTVGQAAGCASYSSNVTLPSSQGPYGVVPGSTQGAGVGGCSQTIPAGPPALTGAELVPADTQLAGGAPPQTVTIPAALIGSLNAKVNRLIGGDFGTNLWQRGTTPVSAASPATYVMSADRWFAISANNVMTVSKVTPSTTAADYLGANGFYSWMRVARPSGTPSGSSCVGQVMDSKQAADFIGKNAVLSFYGYAPSTYSATNSDITVSIAYYTAADSATPGTNTATYALSGSGQTGGIAGYQAAVSGLGVETSGSVASGVATIPLSTTPTVYSVWAPIPAQNASGTEVTGVGVTICGTPTLTTTVSTDYFEIEAVQLQAMPSTVANLLPNGVTGYTGFERLPQALEASRELAYSYVLTDGAATQRYGLGQTLSTSTANLFLQFPDQMRETPALTVGTTISFGVTQPAGAAQACGTSIAGVASSVTPNGDTLLCTTGATNLAAAGGATQFTGAATGALLTYSAEP